jgi:CheY-like chemotaxis protein
MKPDFAILLVEDEENDVLLLKRALKKNGISNQLEAVGNGQDAIDYLLRIRPYEDRARSPYPDVIITDIKMPKKNGLELLQWIKDNPVYRVMPTMVLTSSKDEKDIKQAFYLGANAYFVKPVIFDDLVTLVRRIYDFWSLSEVPI